MRQLQIVVQHEVAPQVHLIIVMSHPSSQRMPHSGAVNSKARHRRQELSMYRASWASQYKVQPDEHRGLLCPRQAMANCSGGAVGVGFDRQLQATREEK